MMAAGFNTHEARDPRLIQAMRLFMAATSVRDMASLADEIRELRARRDYVQCTD